ncbi:MAG TPA: hypothetical protein VF618_24405 [Thermoanaerobaculia bacterium]
MTKINHSNKIQFGRTLVAVSLAASLAAWGCSTNRMPDSGRPEPGVSRSPSATPGQSTSPTGNGMISAANTSVTYGVGSQHSAQSAADQAATQMRNLQARNGLNLGPAAPANGTVVNAQASGQFINPAQFTNPQPTINSSISSGPNAVIASGAGEGDATFLGGEAGLTTGAVAGTTGLTGAATVAGTGTATTGGATGFAGTSGIGLGTTGGTSVAANATASAAGVTPGAFAGGGTTVSPAISSAAVNSPTLAASGIAANGGFVNGGLASSSRSNAILGTTNSASATVSNNAARANATSFNGTATSGLSTRSTGATGNLTASPVRVTRSANGTVTVTNISSGATINGQ